ncbi:MAG: PilC/PilY family type IV pilus protein, partial [Myxococcota bacterium]
MSIQDVEIDGAWRRVLMGGQAQGKGRLNRNYYFALDITDPRDPLPLWEFTENLVEDATLCNPQDGAVTTCVPETCPDGPCSSDCADSNSIFIEADEDTGIVIEAEHFNVASEFSAGEGWEVRTDTDASGGAYMWAPETELCDPGECGGLLVYEIEADVEGEYHVYSLTRSDLGESNRDGNDSFYFSVTNDPDNVTTNHTHEEDGFEWHYDGNTIALLEGDNTLYIWTREGGHALDKIVLRQTASDSGLVDAGPDQTCLEQCEPPPACDQDCTTTNLDISQPWPYCPSGEYCCDSGDEEVFVCNADSSCSGLTVAQTLGETWSKPVLGRAQLTSGDEWFIFFGSGYDNIAADTVSVGRSVYAISVEDGTIYERWDMSDLAFDASNNPSTIQNTLPGGVRLADRDQNGYVDRAYFGDLEGRLWKVDMSVATTESDLRPGGEVAPWPETETPWDACVLFDAGQPSTDGATSSTPRTWAPIITTPEVALFGA